MNNGQWKIVYTKPGFKDKKTAMEAGLGDKISSILGILLENPFTDYPPFEKLIGDLSGAYSRRINRQHRVVYQVYKDEKIVKTISMWVHYD
jgi:Txe/YoeB family toxin of toxin-antitoxin system